LLTGDNHITGKETEKIIMSVDNCCHFIGNLGRDPEMKYLPSGTACTEFSIAVNSYRKLEGGQVQETVWIPLVVFGHSAENANRILAKGDKVAVNSRCRVQSWEAEGGSKRYYTDFVVDGWSKVGSPRGTGEASEDESEADEPEKFPF
jgi:single-strand DNA-binding protein